MRIPSVIHGRDPDVLDAMFGFYRRPTGLVVDACCNARRAWKGLDTAGVVFCDIDPTVEPEVVCDWRKMPFADGSVSALVFDPPHLPAAAGSKRSKPQMVRDYGFRHTADGDNTDGLFAPFLAEAVRVLAPDGLIFAKLIDYVHNHRYQWSLVAWVAAVRGCPGLTPTDLVIKIDPKAGRLTSGRWKATHHCRRSHCWWAVVRKGKCEPGRNLTAVTMTTGRKKGKA